MPFIFTNSAWLLSEKQQLIVDLRKVTVVHFANSPLPGRPAAARSRSRTNIAQEGEAEASSQESLQELMPEEVLVISLGTGPQTVPGMMSENEVMSLELMG